MNETVRHPSILLVLLIAALVLTAAAALRGAEYDEQYTLFVTAGVPRPAWPAAAFDAGEVPRSQAGHAGFARIAHELRTTDVHPPLYFWAVAGWRQLAGGSLFATRLASVLFSLGALVVLAAIARLARIPAATAMLLTLGCYAFTYTGAVARGFALAELLTLSGVALALLAEQGRRRAALPAGLLLGAATFANYLAAFVGLAALLWLALRRTGRAWLLAGLGFMLWLPAELWFFLAQRQTRDGQFPSFRLLHGLARLGQYLAASLFGGLPLYVEGTARAIVALALTALLAALLGIIVWRWRRIGTPGARLLFAMAAAAPPIGLIVLGIVFDTTPIELRYLAFATPFAGLLLAGGFAALPRRWGMAACGLVLVIQTASLAGMLTRPETMQPARATAVAAAALAGDGVVLLPRGNDGVGIVSAFANEAPPALHLLVVDKDEPPARIRARAAGFPRVVLALLAQDAASRATLPAMREAFADPCWRQAGEGFNALAFERICGRE